MEHLSSIGLAHNLAMILPEIDFEENRRIIWLLITASLPNIYCIENPNVAIRYKRCTCAVIIEFMRTAKQTEHAPAFPIKISFSMKKYGWGRAYGPNGKRAFFKKIVENHRIFFEQKFLH